jgi:hypothetical protein
VRIPLPTMPGPVKGKFTFEKPESVNVIGSYQLGTLCKQEINVDLAIQLPKVPVILLKRGHETIRCWPRYFGQFSTFPTEFS